LGMETLKGGTTLCTEDCEKMVISFTKGLLSSRRKGEIEDFEIATRGDTLLVSMKMTPAQLKKMGYEAEADEAKWITLHIG